MSFAGSYLGKLRQKIGHELALMPGACIVVEDEQKRILLTLRVDNNLWCVPGGGAEPGSDFVTTALTELEEETGLTAERKDVIAFACLSDPRTETNHYPNGDVTQYFLMCFIARAFRKKTAAIDATEVKDMAFFAPDDMPKDLTPSTKVVLELYRAYLATSAFQVG